MKIALLLRSKKQPKNEKQEVEKAVVFEVEHDKVVGVESETLEAKDFNDLSFWALTKKVKEVYTPHLDEQMRILFSKLGIKIRGYDELSDDRLFQTFII